MNKLEYQILDSLKELREKYGTYGIKAEFEAEGARMDELIRLRELVLRAELKFIIKIGGCEAVHDMNQCKLLGANGIMAPMIETPFALKKFHSAAVRVYGEDMEDIEWIINAETKTCLQNFTEILKVGNGFLNTVTVGRSDLSASMGIERTEIESDAVYDATRKLVSLAKTAKLTTNFGGNIGIESVPFIINMSDITDRFETRKVVIPMCNDSNKVKQAICSALSFELKYLLNKQNYYSTMSLEDEQRIRRMQHQLSKFQQ